jgi:uncharacterized protein (TIGR03067 family)
MGDGRRAARAGDVGVRRLIRMEAGMSGSLFLVAIAIGAPALKNPPTAGGLTGEWRIESLTIGGEPAPQPDEPDFVVFGSDGKLSSRRGATGLLVERGRFVVQAAAELKMIDIDRGSPDGPSQGIFRVEGETLTICLAADKKAIRPQAFESPPKSEHSLFLLRRVKK